MLPETRYARSGDVSIAYQVVGEGPRDLGSGLEFEERGLRELKGLPGSWHLDAVATG